MKCVNQYGGFNLGHIWKLKKILTPWVSDPLTAMKDPNGNLTTLNEEVDKLKINNFKNVLKKTNKQKSH